MARVAGLELADGLTMREAAAELSRRMGRRVEVAEVRALAEVAGVRQGVKLVRVVKSRPAAAIERSDLDRLAAACGTGYDQ